MNQRRIYSKSPITEAIIDLRIAARPEIALEVLRQLSEETQEGFPRIVPIYEATGKMHVKPGVSASASAHLNQTIVPSLEAKCTSVVLDIDLFRNQGLPDDECRLWECFEVLHDRKNEIFEACITDATRELFD